VLICDDEMLIQLWLEEHLRENGYSAESVGDGTSLMRSLKEAPADLVLLDLRLPDGSGIDLIPQIKELDPELPVIMISAYGEVETAVAAVRAGAHHFLEKPIQLEETLLLIEQALENRRLHQELDRYRDGFRWQFSDVSLVGRSKAMREVAELITRIAFKETAVTVLITGESGTGKDVVARAIHGQSSRQGHPFVRLNCTALPEHLVESELFGHESGAFTDARTLKKGLLELGDAGTVFLDEIGDLPSGAQAKLLGFLETKTFHRLGGVREIDVNVQVLAATNRNLEDAVQRGEFREDLFYRLNVVPIKLPPLRERPEDIAPLALHFTETLAQELRQPVRRISREALNVLERHDWPGNARELRNMLERIILLDDEDPISLRSIPSNLQGLDGGRDKLMVLPASGISLDKLERDLIEQAMGRADGNKTAAARLLGLTRDTMRYRLEKHGLED
jgi:DNA-binding NtrC family response regulator